MVKRRLTIAGNIDRVIALCNEMIELADHSTDCHLDDSGAVFYSVLRDSAYKIRRLAKNERIRHEIVMQSST